MSNVNIAYLGNIAPEYAGFTNTERFNILKGVAEKRISSSYFGDTTDYATALLIAHMLKTTERSASAANVTKEQVGEVSIAYNTNMSNLASTSYGAELKTLMRTFRKTPISW